MLDILELEQILEREDLKKDVISKLGFFSKPIKVKNKKDQDVILKIYKPLKDKRFIDSIVKNHREYITEMRRAGIVIPETHIEVMEKSNGLQLVIMQYAFESEELVRDIMEKAEVEQFNKVLELLLDDTIHFWNNKPFDNLGFHPTTRNYALRDDQLHYFDTFPPMKMGQQELNDIILKMAPVKLGIGKLIPNSAVNRVSDEYYELDKMLVGIVGSCCRLRPNIKDEILKFVRTYFENSTEISDEIRKKMFELVENPPQLPAIWVFFRKLLGKEGKPNIN